MRRYNRLALVAGATAVLAAVGGITYVATTGDTPGPRQEAPGSAGPSAADRLVVKQLHEQYAFEEIDDPDRTVVRDHAGEAVAYLTHGARTVLMSGPRRVFAEPQATDATVTTTSWVRVAPIAYRPSDLDNPVYAGWLAKALHDRTDDVLGASMQYVTGAPVLTAADGIRYAGDAGFGYINNESTRDGADFYDYLGIPWTWPDGDRSQPSDKWERELDCSGYIRLVFGYRMGMTSYRTNDPESAAGLPRSAYAMADRAQSVTIASPRKPDEAPKDLDKVQAGDVVFFALHDEDPGLITHSGIVIGKDNEGRTRFASARSTINGPTIGDVAGDGVIDNGYFGDRLRRIVRL